MRIANPQLKGARIINPAQRGNWGVLDNTKFIHCDFDEEYSDPDSLNSNVYAHSLTDGTEQTPGTYGHPYLIDFIAARVLIDGCSISTHYYNKWASIFGGGNQAYQVDYAVIKNSGFYNDGIALSWPNDPKSLGIFYQVDLEFIT